MKQGDIVKKVGGYVPFKVSDRSTKVGIVVRYPDRRSACDVGVEWYGLEAGHNCRGACVNGQGWFVDKADLEVVEEY